MSHEGTDRDIMVVPKPWKVREIQMVMRDFSDHAPMVCVIESPAQTRDPGSARRRNHDMPGSSWDPGPFGEPDAEIIAAKRVVGQMAKEADAAKLLADEAGEDEPLDRDEEKG